MDVEEIAATLISLGGPDGSDNTRDYEDIRNQSLGWKPLSLENLIKAY